MELDMGDGAERRTEGRMASANKHEGEDNWIVQGSAIRDSGLSSGSIIALTCSDTRPLASKS